MIGVPDLACGRVRSIFGCPGEFLEARGGILGLGKLFMCLGEYIEWNGETRCGKRV